MCEIYRKADGTYGCVCRIQDGAERWSSLSLEEAVKDMKESAYVLNHDKIKKSDIAYFEERQVTRTEFVRVKL